MYVRTGLENAVLECKQQDEDYVPAEDQVGLSNIFW